MGFLINAEKREKKELLLVEILEEMVLFLHNLWRWKRGADNISS